MTYGSLYTRAQMFRERVKRLFFVDGVVVDDVFTQATSGGSCVVCVRCLIADERVDRAVLVARLGILLGLRSNEYVALYTRTTVYDDGIYN